MKNNILNKVSTVGVVVAIAALVSLGGISSNTINTAFGYGYGASSPSTSSDPYDVKNDPNVSVNGQTGNTTTDNNTGTTNPTTETPTNTKTPTTSDRIFKINGDKVYSLNNKTCAITKSIVDADLTGFNTNFNDISKSKYINDIKRLEKTDIVHGTTPTTFEPSRSITRAEFLAILLQSHCYDVSKVPSSLPFSDVSLSTWQARVVHAALEKGIIYGDTKDGKRVFRPNDQISNIEAMAMIVALRDIKVPTEFKHSYTDIAADWQNGVLNIVDYLDLDPNNSKLFRPNSGVDRDTMSHIIVSTVRMY